MEGAGKALLAIITGAFVVAIVAMVVSQQSSAGTVITDFATGFSNIIKAATGPFSGTSSTG